MKPTWLDTKNLGYFPSAYRKTHHYIGPAIQFEEKEIKELKNDIGLYSLLETMFVIECNATEVITINVKNDNSFWKYTWSDTFYNKIYKYISKYKKEFSNENGMV